VPTILKRYIYTSVAEIYPLLDSRRWFWFHRKLAARI